MKFVFVNQTKNVVDILILFDTPVLEDEKYQLVFKRILADYRVIHFWSMLLRASLFYSFF